MTSQARESNQTPSADSYAWSFSSSRRSAGRTLPSSKASSDSLGEARASTESRAAAEYLHAWSGALRAVRQERDHLERTLHEMAGTSTWRLRAALLKVPGLWTASRWLRGRP